MLNTVKLSQSGLNIGEDQIELPNYDVNISLKIAFTLTNSANPDEMLHFVTFHLSLHFLSKFFFMKSL